MQNAPLLQRTPFETSRLLEFFSDKELSMQMGAARHQWPATLLKELIDNALDACEAAGVAPEITVTVGPESFSVQDNGPGMPQATLERSLDYLVRVSDKSYYVSPTRGQLGNALKCVWAAPYVAHGEHGHIEVVTGAVTHSIDVTLDRIAQKPMLAHTIGPGGVVKKGTLVKITWPEIASYLGNSADVGFYNALVLCQRYAMLNPHATFHYIEEDYRHTFPATERAWQKWLPSNPTSPHWYSVEHLRALIAAYLAEEQAGGRSRTVREFVSEFHGLKGTLKQKAVTDAAGLSGAVLHDLVHEGDVTRPLAFALWKALQQESREVKPAALGVLGEPHLKWCLYRDYGVDKDSLKYKKVAGVVEGVPFVLEMAFGWFSEELSNYQRDKVIGLNFSPCLKDPFPELSSLLGEARVDEADPVAIVVHLASPRLSVVDRGKSAIVLPLKIRRALSEGLLSLTKHWKAMKLHKERVSQRERTHYLTQQRQKCVSAKAAAYQVMEEAYRKASNNGKLPANARQVMYAARPLVLALTGGKSWKNSSYFTQQLLPDFVSKHPEETAQWDVVFDARGHLLEPHTGEEIGLGTLEVRHYTQRWQSTADEQINGLTLSYAFPTSGPAHRYRFALFVEKEGFNPLLKAMRIAERYDLAIMSTKGMSVTAARQLVEDLTKQGVTILVLHDFDKAGFSIVHTLRTDTRRHQFSVKPNVIDLGLRMADVHTMALESEAVEYDSKVDPRENLRQSGATEEECSFLVRQATSSGWIGERVELNAMTSQQFIDWLETQLQAVGVEKMVPDQATLEKAYRRTVRQAAVQRAIDAAVQDLDQDMEIIAPADLTHQVREAITGTEQSWDKALWQMVRENDNGREP